MQVNNGRIQTLDQELKKLSEIVLRLAPLAQQELLNYRMIETQHSQLIETNKEWARKNAEAEEQLRKTIEATKTIEAQNQSLKNQNNANINALWVKASQKFKDIEKMLEDADRARIKRSLKELEAAAA